MKQLTGLTFAAILLGGCATSPQPSATHHWVYTETTHAQYQVHNSQCTRIATGDTEQRNFDPGSDAYREYVDCMNDRGYELVAKNDL